MNFKKWRASNFSLEFWIFKYQKSCFLLQIQRYSTIKQSQNRNLNQALGNEEVSDGCRKMFSGFNILDNKKPGDILDEIQASSFQPKLSSTFSSDDLEPTTSSVSRRQTSHSKMPSRVEDDNFDATKNLTVSNEDDIVLLNAIFSYARENVALVNIYIKPPVVTRILRDQRTPIIWWV